MDTGRTQTHRQTHKTHTWQEDGPSCQRASSRWITMYFLCICLSVFVSLQPPICSPLYIKAKLTLFDSFLPQTHWNPPCTSSFPCFILVCSLIKEHENTRRCTRTSKYNVSRWLPDLILRFLSRVPNAWAECVLHSQCETTEAAKIPTVWTAPDTICMQFFLRWSWGGCGGRVCQDKVKLLSHVNGTFTCASPFTVMPACLFADLLVVF